MRLVLVCLLLSACEERWPSSNPPDAGEQPDAVVCSGLDPTTCAATAGCQVENGCGEVVCASTNAPKPKCPLQGCRSGADCPGASCLMQNPGWCGTPCPDPTSSCASDADCDPGSICDEKPCCPEATACTPGCTDASQCALAGQDCVSGRCVPRTCGDASDSCPRNSTCVTDDGALVGECQPSPCASDVDCDTFGYCVDGACEDRMGMCYAPVP